MDEETFLKAIGAAPDDETLRLVYADWLDERGDGRAEFVRLQVELRSTPDDDLRLAELRQRERLLREDMPPLWAARLDPPVWCAVGNIIDSPLRDGSGRRGTPLFRPGAKVVLATCSHWYALRDLERFGFEAIEVLGQHRKSRQWICSWVRASRTRRWRVRLLHDPGAKARLREVGWPLWFVLRPNEFDCPVELRDSPEAVGRLFDAIDAAHKRQK